MKSGARELWLALLAIVLVTLIYVFVTVMIGAIPSASQFFGHALGILGIILMLMTEVLYSLRKRSHGVRWGPMSAWLRFHIFTGLVGPYLAMLHTSWKFKGLAGVLAFLTIVIVISGFVGRYIYTAIPRTVDGLEIETSDPEAQTMLIRKAVSLKTARNLMATWHTLHIPIGMVLFTIALIHAVATLYLATFLH
jgi:hypothetical protein